MKSFILALKFLTVFPVKKEVDITRGALASSMAYFPLVGALQGAVLVAAYFILIRALPLSVVTALLLAILVLTNGALHLDGFADTVDALAGGSTPEERLRIMRDSSVGAVGVVFVVLLLLVKYAALNEVPQDAKERVIFIFPAAGRWAMVPMACWARYAREEGGIGEAFSGNSLSTLIISTLIIAVLTALSLGILSLLILAAIGLSVYMFTRFFKRRIGGVTGDVFGFQCEAAEALFLILFLVLSRVLSTDFS